MSKPIRYHRDVLWPRVRARFRERLPHIREVMVIELLTVFATGIASVTVGHPVADWFLVGAIAVIFLTALHASVVWIACDRTESQAIYSEQTSALSHVTGDRDALRERLKPALSLSFGGDSCCQEAGGKRLYRCRLNVSGQSASSVKCRLDRIEWLDNSSPETVQAFRKVTGALLHRSHDGGWLAEHSVHPGEPCEFDILAESVRYEWQGDRDVPKIVWRLEVAIQDAMQRPTIEPGRYRLVILASSETGTDSITLETRAEENGRLGIALLDVAT